MLHVMHLKSIGRGRVISMQYQVIDQNGKLIAWIDSDNNEQIIHKDYILRQGDHLDTIVDDTNGKMIPVFKMFMKGE